MPYFFLLFLLFVGCKAEKKPVRNLEGEYIFRRHNEYLFPRSACKQRPLPRYPWEEKVIKGMPRITKEFFRCKGKSSNPATIQEREGKASLTYRDCSGDHGLPLREGKEFIYPCLINLLNYVQEQTGNRVVITTGHRCPTHNLWADPSKSNWGSKHMLGAEVDFYVEGWEERPEKIIEILQNYYSRLKDSEYCTFCRYEKEKLNVSTPPWYNKEIFVKLYLPHEGRDKDNEHPFPYIGIQVRFDGQSKQLVKFDQLQAQNYLRH